jgi:small subunit ribosomal protein S14
MAKKSAVEKNERRRRMSEGTKAKRDALREKFHRKDLSDEERHEVGMRLNKMAKNSAPCRVRNRCLMSGRPRGFYRRFYMSRIALREMASSGLLPGVIKASW